jgi:hypothetical protein
MDGKSRPAKRCDADLGAGLEVVFYIPWLNKL